MTLAGGGDDVTYMLFHMLKEINFPYKSCDLRDHLDWETIDKIKQTICNITEVWACPTLLASSLHPHGGNGTRAMCKMAKCAVSSWPMPLTTR